MKCMKRFISFLMAFVMVIAMSITAFAAQGINTDNGRIIIDNAVVGQDYTIYRILDLESYDTGTGAYSYKVTEAWKPFVERADIKDKYLKVETQGYVSWVQDADVTEFAKLAFEYAKTLENQGTQTAASTRIEFSELPFGFYLCSSTVGTVCSLNTAAPTVNINDKNMAPVIHKRVEGNVEGAWKMQKTVAVGDTVKFRTVVHATKGGINYRVHDKMTAGLTFNADSIAITKKVNISDQQTTETQLTAGTDYTLITTGLTDDCTFHIEFSEGILKDLTDDVDFVITYSATLNEDAVVRADTDTPTSENTNINTTKLDYGNEITTEEDLVEIRTLEFDLVKTNSKNEVLDGAEFELYDTQTGGTRIPLKKLADGTYIIATEGVTGDGFVSATIQTNNGIATIKGLNSEKFYYLEETKAPAGYNKLHERVAIRLQEKNAKAKLENNRYKEGGIHVINNTGTQIPATGGTGTTLFYVIGGILAVGAAILLVVKRRMRAN